MNEEELKIRFPRASASFLAANTGGLRPLERKQDPRQPLAGQTPGKEKSDARVILCIVMRRVRILDKDNAYGATKCLTDCLCQVGLIPGDSEKEIDLQVKQEKVDHLFEQGTDIKITQAF